MLALPLLSVLGSFIGSCSEAFPSWIHLVEIGQVRVAIIGTAGVPAAYGGFETLAENLVRFNDQSNQAVKLTVYCTSIGKTGQPEKFGQASLSYIKLKPNGVQSIAYDAVSIFHAVLNKHNCILLLGVSGALCLPFVRWFTPTRILTNLDGIEWKRAKWNRLARLVLRISEWIAVRFSHVIIADNAAIADYLGMKYKAKCEVIAYGGDHALEPKLEAEASSPFGRGYALALCRIEPENNVQMILEAWEKLPGRLVFIGNWDSNSHGRGLAKRFANTPNIEIVDPIYDPSLLKRIRRHATLYLHGHSAGGTNPSLVEMMHFGIPIAAYDCAFNRCTTEGKAMFFNSKKELRNLLMKLDPEYSLEIGREMAEIARRRYTWDAIGESYFSLFNLK